MNVKNYKTSVDLFMSPLSNSGGVGSISSRRFLFSEFGFTGSMVIWPSILPILARRKALCLLLLQYVSIFSQELFLDGLFILRSRVLI